MKVIYGAAYYIEYSTSDRLETDLQLMEDAGINTIRIGESTWSVEEPREGEYDFARVTEVIEAAARHGISVIVGTPTYAVPAWLAALDPGVLGGNRFGPRQNMDITDPTYRKYAERIIREIVSRTAGYENVIGYQIDNETKHYYMHSDRVICGFREWLRKRFGTIEALNNAYGLNHWSNSVASFEELPDPAGAVNGSYACAFDEYRRELAAEFLRWQAGIVGEYKRDDQFITHNFDYEWRQLGAPGQQMGRSYGMQPDLNTHDAAAAVTLAGTDVYFPAGDRLTGQEIAFAGDLMRPLKRAPYLVIESQAQAFTGWLPYPGQLRQMALAHIASGACGVMYWPWMSIHNGIEAYWKGVLSHDGLPGETYEEVREIGSVLRRVAGLPGDDQGSVMTAQGKTPRIAVVVSCEALHAMRWFPTDNDLGYNDVVMQFHRALYELGLECDVIYDRDREWSRYDMLVFPELYCADDSMIGQIRDHVREGGTVFAGYRSFFADENLKIRDGIQPYGLTDVFGMHYSRFTRTDEISWMELLEEEGADVLERYDHRHWGRYAAATHNIWGSGHAWYLGYTAGDERLKELLAAAAETAGIELPADRFPVITRTSNGLKFIFNFSDEEKTASIVSGSEEILTGDILTGDRAVIPEWGTLILKID